MTQIATPLFQSALLVEDELNLAIALQVALKKMNIIATRASTLADAKKLITQAPPEFALLDRCLPDGDGLELCDLLRKMNENVLILVLTASGQIEEKVHGLNTGADDYLSKPFSWEELEARIRALARRNKKPSSSIPQKGSSLWEQDESRLRVLGPQGWITLTPLEFKLASCLIQEKGGIISRAELLKKVWGFTLLPKTRTVDHFLGRLRKHFEETPENPRHFLTIRGAGYRFEK